MPVKELYGILIQIEFVTSYSNAILGKRTRRITLADRKLCGLAVLALVDRAEKLLAANVAAFAVLLLSPTATAFARAELVPFIENTAMRHIFNKTHLLSLTRSLSTRLLPF